MYRFVFDKLLGLRMRRQAEGCMHEEPQLSPEEEMREQAGHAVLCNQDLLKLLFEKLGRHALCSAGATCRQWRQVAASDEFWSAIDFSGLNISPWQMASLLQRHPNVQVLDLRGIPAGASLFQQDLPALTRLSQLVLGDDLLEISNADLAALNQLVPSLQQLTLHQANFVCEQDGMIASDSVEDVVLEDCNARGICFNCPNMRQLSLKFSKMVSFTLHNCSSLRSLDLQCVRKLNNRHLLRGLLGMAELTSLNMQCQPDLTDDTLRVAATRLGKLQELLLSSCAGVTLSAVRGFSALTFLDLSHCEALLPASAVVALETFTRLEHLKMNGCSGMTSIALNLPFLRKVSFQDCPALTQVDLRCPSLRVCNLGSGVDSKLKQIHVSSRSLHKICWQGFQALADLHITCPHLNSVDLSDCNELDDTIFQSLCDGRIGLQGWNVAAVDGGSPKLRELSLERCEGLSLCELSNSCLQRLSLADCPGLHTLRLLCPALQCLNLEECKLLRQVDLRQVGLTTLCLGTCPHLTSLAISAPLLAHMDLKGCNVLECLKLNCPSLTSFDATFCTQLDSLTLSRALTGAPRLTALVLSVCMGLDPVIPATMCSIARLSLLDLSYTGIEDLESIAQCCPALTSLNISSCRSLRPAALSVLLPRLALQQHMRDAGAPTSSCALPALISLDVSYCALPPEMVCSLLQHGHRFQEIAMNGCSGVTEAIWDHVNTANIPDAMKDDVQQPPHHALQSLSLVGCKSMRSCQLGLMPSPHQELLGSGQLHGQSPLSWLPAICQMSGLQSLKLGLSGARSVALALPQLTALDMNNCVEIRHLELRCPCLLTAYFQACGLLSGPMLVKALQDSQDLNTLDVQHINLAAGTFHQLKHLPLLKSILHAQQF